MNLISNIINCRKAVDSAQSQLEKGREMFSSIVFPLAEMSSTWSHRGLIFLPNIGNRGDLRHHGITEEEIKVINDQWEKYKILKYLMQNIITKRELENKNYSLLMEVFSDNQDDPERKKIKLDFTADYKKLISLLLGSLYVSFQSQTFSNSDHIKKTTKRLTGGASQVDRAEFPEQPVQFTELMSKALGDIKRIGSI